MTSLTSLLCSSLSTLSPSSSPSSINSLSTSLSSSSSPPPDAQELSLLISLLTLLPSLLKIPTTFPSPSEDELLSTNPEGEEQMFIDRVGAVLDLGRTILDLVIAQQATLPLELSTILFISFSRVSSPPFSSSSSSSSSAVLDTLVQHQPSLRSSILKTDFPLYFSKRKHPKLNPETGRKSTRVRGGENGMMQWFEEGEHDVEEDGWRESRGLSNVVREVVKRLDRKQIEELWPYLLSPILTFLDDFSVPHKLSGLKILNSFITLLSSTSSNTPFSDGTILRRTGVGEIFVQSLLSNLTSLSSPLSPVLLPQTQQTYLSLLPLLHLPSSPSHFQSLSTLFSSSLIQPLSFKSGSITFELSLAKPLPSLLKTHFKKFITIRYLKFLIPHYSSIISFPPPSSSTLSLVLSAIEILRTTWEVVEGEKDERIRKRWSTGVVCAAARCWIEVDEGELGEEEKRKVKEELKVLIGVVGDGGKRKELIKLDERFEELFFFD